MHVFTSAAEAAAIEPEWRRLVLEHPSSSYFMSPDWGLSWWETVGAGHRSELAVWCHEGAAEAVVGLSQVSTQLHRRVPVRVTAMTNLGSGAGAADHCGWMVSQRRRADVAAWLAEKADGSSLLLANLDPDVASDALTGRGRLVGETRCPRVELATTDLPPGSAKLRKRLRYHSRRLEKRGVSLEWVGPDRISADVLDDVLRLHAGRDTQMGWRSQFDETRRALHVRTIERAGPGRGPAAVVARQDDRVVGVLYGFRWRDEFAYYQTGWSPELAQDSPGSVLVAAAMRFASDDGARVFDFLRGPEEYKYRFGATDRIDRTWLVPQGMAGRLLAWKYAATRRVETARET